MRLYYQAKSGTFHFLVNPGTQAARQAWGRPAHTSSLRGKLTQPLLVNRAGNTARMPRGTTFILPQLPPNTAAGKCSLVSWGWPLRGKRRKKKEKAGKGRCRCSGDTPAPCVRTGMAAQGLVAALHAECGALLANQLSMPWAALHLPRSDKKSLDHFDLLEWCPADQLSQPAARPGIW